MKKIVRMLVLTVVLSVALGVTALAIEDSKRQNYKWSNYSGTCTLVARPEEVSVSMSVTVDSLGMTQPDAMFETQGTAYFANPDGTGVLMDRSLDSIGYLPTSIGASDSIGKAATYLDYLSVSANCTYSIPSVGGCTTLTI